MSTSAKHAATDADPPLRTSCAFVVSAPRGKQFHEDAIVVSIMITLHSYSGSSTHSSTTSMVVDHSCYYHYHCYCLNPKQYGPCLAGLGLQFYLLWAFRKAHFEDSHVDPKHPLVTARCSYTCYPRKPLGSS